jgi:hypothetical protein
MIHYLLTERGDHTFRGSPILDDPRLEGRFDVVTYDEAFQRRHWQGGAVIFADLDRLGSGDVLRATILYRRLRLSRGPIRLLNHPTRSCRRYGLLRRLHEAGINEHNAYRVDEGRRPDRYPVFLRSDSEHDGAYTPLLYDEAALDAELWRLTSFGFRPQDLLIVEFCETADSDGVYRKATGYIVGDAVFQRFMFFGDHWEVKQPRSGGVALKRAEQAMIDDEEAFLGGVEYLPVLRRVAEIGGYGFGRIDFGIKGGQPVIWEVNTNPDPAVLRYSRSGERATRIGPLGWNQLRDALVVLDDDAAHAVEIEIEPPPATAVWYDWFKAEVRTRAGKPAG